MSILHFTIGSLVSHLPIGLVFIGPLHWNFPFVTSTNWKLILDLIDLEASSLEQWSYQNVDCFTMDWTFVGSYSYNWSLVKINVKTLCTKSITTFQIIQAPVVFVIWFNK